MRQPSEDPADAGIDPLLRIAGLDKRFGERWLLRPLLSEPRSELEAFARAGAVAWVDDDSNVDERFDRNYLRQRVCGCCDTKPLCYPCSAW